MAERQDYNPEEQDLNSFEAFLYRYQQPLSIGLGVIVVIVLGYLAWDQWYLSSRNQQAQTEIYHAQKHFENDSLEMALNGDGKNPGFKDIIEDYGWTKTGNLAYYYSGIIYLKKEQYDKAIDHLESFDTESKMLKPLSLGSLGNAYSEKEQYSTAADYYLQAANAKPNKFTSPIYLMKAGVVLEENGQYQKALDAYKKIKNEYPDSDQASDIEKYIARARAKVNATKS